MVQEKRQFTRVFFDVPAKFEVAGKVFSIDQLVNLSVGGCLVEIEVGAKSGDICQITIYLSNDESNVRVEGEIIRVKNGEASVKFTSIDLESLHHLQNIIKFNASDPDSIEDEIAGSPGIK